MLSLRCARWVAGLLVLPLVGACSNGTGSIEQPEQPPPAAGAQDGFTVGGTVNGLVGTGLVLQNNGGGDLPIATDGAFTFATRLATGTAYTVVVSSQPTSPSQTCSVTRGSGSIAAANVADVVVSCATGQFSIRVTVTGLTGTGLVLQNNGGNDLRISANGAFSFANRLIDRATYAVVVSAQPTGQNCVVRNSTGAIRGADANVEVACSTNGFTIGGAVSGLVGSGLVLQLNRANDLTIVGNTAFAFETTLQNGARYEVSVRTQPGNPPQECAIANGSGTVTGTNVTNIAVNCVVRSFTVGGTVSGLVGSGLALELNGGNRLQIASDGSFRFAIPVPSGAEYHVKVASVPANPPQECSVTGGDGRIGNANVNNVRVNCAASTFFVGGTVVGLLGRGLELQNNGGETVTVNADGDFRFPTKLASGAEYSVSVRTPPTDPDQSCSVRNGSGKIGSSDVSNIVVSCSTADFTIGGTVSGLEGSGLVLRNKGGDDLTIDRNGTFVFGTALTTGARYDVTIAQQPRDPDQTCEVSNRSGTVGTSNVTNITVSCETRNFSVGGRVTHLRGLGGLEIQNNGGDTLQIASEGPFTFPTRLPEGSPYDVTISRQPLLARCEVRHGSGTIRDRNIDDVEVRCDR
jgi:hypothetical protein